MLLHGRVLRHLAVRHGRSDMQAVLAAVAQVGKFCNALQINNDIWQHCASMHAQEQIRAAGQHPGATPMLTQKCYCFPDTRRIKVLEIFQGLFPQTLEPQLGGYGSVSGYSSKMAVTVSPALNGLACFGSTSSPFAPTIESRRADDCMPVVRAMYVPFSWVNLAR